MITKIRRKRVRARLVNGRDAMKGWGSEFARCLYVIDELGIAQDLAGWFAVKPQALSLSDGEFALEVANGNVGRIKLDWNPYDRYIIDFCDEHGNVIDTAR
jgi:hypothetical protein